MTAPLPQFDGSQACASADPEAFFPVNGEGVRYTKQVCAGCKFRDPCLSYALIWNVSGIWGGTTEYERKKHRRRLGITAKPLAPMVMPGRDEQIHRLHKQGVPIGEIATRVGMTSVSVHRILRGAA